MSLRCTFAIRGIRGEPRSNLGAVDLAGNEMSTSNMKHISFDTNEIAAGETAPSYKVVQDVRLSGYTVQSFSESEQASFVDVTSSYLGVAPADVTIISVVNGNSTSSRRRLLQSADHSTVEIEYEVTIVDVSLVQVAQQRALVGLGRN